MLDFTSPDKMAELVRYQLKTSMNTLGPTSVFADNILLF